MKTLTFKQPIVFHVRKQEGCIDLVSGDTHVAKIPFNKKDGTEAIGDMSFNEAATLAAHIINIDMWIISEYKQDKINQTIENILVKGYDVFK